MLDHLFLQTNLTENDHDITYLTEIVEDYKASSAPAEKETIFRDFCRQLWGSGNKRRIYKKNIRYRVDKQFRNTAFGGILQAYSQIEYLSYKAYSKERDWCSLIRQKINNLYSIHFDKQIILEKEYLALLSVPQNLYYEIRSGTLYSPEILQDKIESALADAERCKARLAAGKITLSWNDYKEIIETYLRKCLDNCISPDEYQANTLSNTFGIMEEDNFYIKYFCKCLNGYIKNYKYTISGLYVPNRNNKKYNTRSCVSCGKLYLVKSPNQRRCPACTSEVRYYSPAKIKTRTCVDCHTDFVVSSKNNQTCRCESCKKIYQRERDRLRKQQYRCQTQSGVPVPSAI